MAKKIIRFPGQASRWMLRLIGVMVTFIFTLFVYTSGQVIKSAGLGKSSTNPGASSAALSADTMNAAQVVPDYGVISPMYGVAEYGMPYASFSIKGKIRAEEGGAGIPKIKVSATDTSNKITIDSAITQADGSFSMTFEESPALNAWILDVRDVDGVFQRKDTLVSIPRDSLKGGTGFYAGAGSADIELFLTTGTAAIVPDNGSAKMLPKVTASWGKSGAITLRYTLAVQGRTVISLFSVTGKLVREISDTWESSGDHDIQVASAGLTTGAYFLKLQTATHAVITKVLIAR